MSAPWSSRYCTIRFEPIIAAPCRAVDPFHRISPRSRWASSSSRFNGCRRSSSTPSPSMSVSPNSATACKSFPSSIASFTASSLTESGVPFNGPGLSPSQNPTPAADINGVTPWSVGVRASAPCSTSNCMYSTSACLAAR